MVASKHCVVTRAYQTLVLGQAPVANKAPLNINGQPTQMQVQVQTFAVNHHELQPFGPVEEYNLMCKYCGQYDAQVNWVIELARPEVPSAGS